jgi:hypothetical protein
MPLHMLKSLFAPLVLCVAFLPSSAEDAAAPIPVKVFAVSHDQHDHGTSAYEKAVRDQVSKMPAYKLWTGSPKDFPKNGIFIDIQGIDVLDSNEAVIGSAVIATASVQSKKEPGYSRVLVQNLLEIIADGDDVADEAAELLADINRRLPHTPAK